MASNVATTMAENISITDITDVMDVADVISDVIDVHCHALPFWNSAMQGTIFTRAMPNILISTRFHKA